MLAVPVLLWLGCASAEAPAVVVPRAAPEPAEPGPETPSKPREMTSQQEVLAGERMRAIELEQQAVRLRVELAAAQQRSEALEAELVDTLEEVLRAKASIRGVHSRALATSRIAEVRVALEESLAASSDATGSTRASQLLGRADSELAAGNFGGAVYLADRASDVLRQARLAEATSTAHPTAEDPVEALLPVLAMTINSRANLREGPGLHFSRRSALEPGERVMTLAVSADWRYIERSGGERGWVYSRLLDVTAASAVEAVERAIPLDSPRSMETVERANLRVGPGIDFGRVVVLERGVGVRALASLGDWMKVEVSDGRSGWVHGSLLLPVAE